MHKLHQTIVISDIANVNPDKATSAIPNKPITTPSITVNPRKDRTATLQYPKIPNLQPANSN